MSWCHMSIHAPSVCEGMWPNGDSSYQWPQCWPGLEDGRTTNGLRKRVARLLESDAVEGGLLRNYLKVIESAEALQSEKNVMVMEDDVLASHWKMVAAGDSCVPSKVGKWLF